MATATPWGPSQESIKIAVGIMQYSTASHGGIHLSKKRNAMIPEYMRNDNGWYEEDCKWAIVGCVFPEEFVSHYNKTMIDIKLLATTDIDLLAMDTLCEWFPDSYEKFYNVKVKKGESHVRDEELFLEENKDNYIVISAIGVDYDMVECSATKGGIRKFPVEGVFLVPADEYRNRDKAGFIINPEIHSRIS